MWPLTESRLVKSGIYTFENPFSTKVQDLCKFSSDLRIANHVLDIEVVLKSVQLNARRDKLKFIEPVDNRKREKLNSDRTLLHTITNKTGNSCKLGNQERIRKINQPTTTNYGSIHRREHQPIKRPQPKPEIIYNPLSNVHQSKETKQNDWSQSNFKKPMPGLSLNGRSAPKPASGFKSSAQIDNRTASNARLNPTNGSPIPSVLDQRKSFSSFDIREKTSSSNPNFKTKVLTYSVNSPVVNNSSTNDPRTDPRIRTHLAGQQPQPRTTPHSSVVNNSSNDPRTDPRIRAGLANQQQQTRTAPHPLLPKPPLTNDPRLSSRNRSIPNVTALDPRMNENRNISTSSTDPSKIRGILKNSSTISNGSNDSNSSNGAQQTPNRSILKNKSTHQIASRDANGLNGSNESVRLSNLPGGNLSAPKVLSIADYNLIENLLKDGIPNSDKFKRKSESMIVLDDDRPANGIDASGKQNSEFSRPKLPSCKIAKLETFVNKDQPYFRQSDDGLSSDNDSLVMDVDKSVENQIEKQIAESAVAQYKTGDDLFDEVARLLQS